MADYDFNSLMVYDRDGGSSNASFGSGGDAVGTLSDNEMDGSFEPGDPIYVDGSPTQVGTFWGSYTDPDSGNTYVVVEVDSDTFYVYSVASFAEASTEVPNTVHETDDLDTGTFVTCFMAGTRIAVPGGEVAVETLVPGDLVLTADGRAVPVLWLGRRSVHRLFPAPERFAPVRVRDGALGRGLPRRDLVLTADHALVLDGLAINAGALVNGDTIAVEPMAALPERITYYHVETEGHETILAEGAPAESYIDYVARTAFDNYADYVARCGAERVIREMPLPRISSARLVPGSIRARLGALADVA